MQEMNPNLMGTAGEKPAKHYAVVADLFYDFKPGVRSPPLGSNRHLLSMERIAPDRFSNIADFLPKYSAADR